MSNLYVDNCPCCGSKGWLIKDAIDHYFFPENAIVGCVAEDCGVRVYAATNHKAIDIWNRRTNATK